MSLKPEGSQALKKTLNLGLQYFPIACFAWRNTESEHTMTAFSISWSRVLHLYLLVPLFSTYFLFKYLVRIYYSAGQKQHPFTCTFVMSREIDIIYQLLLVKHSALNMQVSYNSTPIDIDLRRTTVRSRLVPRKRLSCVTQAHCRVKIRGKTDGGTRWIWRMWQNSLLFNTIETAGSTYKELQEY